MHHYEDEKYDIFIAYYGNKLNGSENSARELFEQINNMQLTPNKRIRAYFHPAINPYGSFEETPMIVARTPMFLLVADKNIPTSRAGQLPKQRPDGTLSNLYEEVRTFHDSFMYKTHGGDKAVKVFIADNMSFKAAECLHPVFGGKTALTSCSEVQGWIRDFYLNTYIERLSANYKYLANAKPDEFLQGDWISEAEEVWQAMPDERIGRSLLVYYTIKTQKADASAKKRLSGLYREFYRMSRLDSNTRILLEKVRNLLI